MEFHGGHLPYLFKGLRISPNCLIHRQRNIPLITAHQAPSAFRIRITTNDNSPRLRLLPPLEALTQARTPTLHYLSSTLLLALRKTPFAVGSNISDEIVARPRPRRRLSSVYSTESIHSGSSDVSVNEDESNDRSNLVNNSNNYNHTISVNGGDKYSVFNSLRRTDSSYKGWSKEVLGIGPYGWSEEILEGGYESTDSAFSNGSDDGPKVFNQSNPFSTLPDPSSLWNNASSPNTNFLPQFP
ncbi:unnamed protein product [Lepeophtheirus salmonis]|uniref:(salmon louse) hypothetical protein n=1 Tax=Lepeophtheirus salmonis TaxID=72036 RepID=A0A7R8DA55_LEPSM|nr:unnamed protein product [Lepeophtheirus salmonis]CAF3023395.1 unnamed protein product [Lepeophtheirus salmonis]